MLERNILDYLFTTMGISREWSVRDENSFTWWPHHLAQRVWSEPIEVPDGSEYVRVHAETAVYRNVPNTYEIAQRLELFNKLVSMSAFLWDTVGGRVTLHCTMNISEETFGWTKNVLAGAVAIQAADAHIKGTSDGATLLRSEPDESAHPSSGIRQKPDEMIYVIERAFAPIGAGLAPFTREDFEDVVRMKPSPCVMANADESGLTAEFSYRGEATGVETALGLAEDLETALLQVTKERHPQLGSGVHLRLTLPINFDSEEAITLVHELNRAETCGNTFSYLLGAWCFDPKLKGICFVSYLPAMLYKKNILQAFVWSMATRSRWARSYLSRRADKAGSNLTV